MAWTVVLVTLLQLGSRPGSDAAPILGEPADLLNAGLYTLEGDIINAGIAGASAIPA